MALLRLTDISLAQSTAITPTTLIHIVTTGDTTQFSGGSSYKAELGQLTSIFSGSPQIYTTAFTYSNNTFTIFDNSGSTFSQTVNDFSGLTINGNLNVTGDTILNNITATTISATTYQNLPIDPDTYTTAFTYNNNTFTISDNSGSTFSQTVNDFTGLTINGNLTITGNTTSQGLTANTISATTYQNLPIDPDTYTTGFTYSANTFTILDNSGNTFNATISDVTGLTVNGGLSATTLSAVTIGSSGDCVDDLYVSNIHSCSPLYINPLSEGNVFVGSANTLTIDLTNERVGISITSPTAKLHINNTGSTNTVLFEDDTNPDSTPFVIDNTGRVGIGTSSPTAKEHIVGGSGDTTFSLKIQDSVGDVYVRARDDQYFGVGRGVTGISPISRVPSFESCVSSSTGSFQHDLDTIWFKDTIRTSFWSVYNNVSFGTYSAHDLQLVTNNTTQMTVTSGGNIGIGTSSPSSKLEVSGRTITTNFTMTSGATNGYVLTSDVSGNASWSPSTGGGSFTGGTVTGATIFTGGVSANTISATTYQSTISNTQVVYSNNGTLTGSTAMTWTNSATTLSITGTLEATSKSFVIPHPTKEGKKLVYGSLEGPENGVYHRGKLTNENTILLPEYWSKLVDENTVTVNLTPIGRFQNLYVKEVLSDKIIVDIESGLFGNKTIECYYTVYGERKDTDKLVIER